MRVEFTVSVEVERTTGKFATKDEIREAITQDLEGANPSEITGIGPDSATNYGIVAWEVEDA